MSICFEPPVFLLDSLLSYRGLPSKASSYEVPRLWSELRSGFVQFEDGAAPTSLSTLSAGALSMHIPERRVPDDVVFADALPIGATGKVLKACLRERYRDYRVQPQDD
jgi:acyl-CoA synthetase (AMP-forming)/AMP-acid ligase II